tara:strand:+ start:967 stop:1239 length:273 start_codon:yes stop_codon:yes gene_type:complete
MDSQSVVNKSGLLAKVKANFQNLWINLNESQQKILKKFWQILTYKWQWQIALNTPFLVIWVLDKSIPSVHQFDMNLINSLPIPNWAYTFM